MFNLLNCFTSLKLVVMCTLCLTNILSEKLVGNVPIRKQGWVLIFRNDIGVMG